MQPPSTILFVLVGWYHSVSSQISLPFKDSIATGLSFDGQPLKMMLDTSLSGTYVVYKEWYEKTFGKGACKRSQGGCYSCPGECNPYSRERNVLTFLDGGSITSVIHEGMVKIGKYKLKMKFRLIIGYSAGAELPHWKPPNYLGLGFADSSNLETLPRSLYDKGIIKRYTISICSPSDPVFFQGTVILGEWKGLCRIKSDVTTIPMAQSHDLGHILSDLSSYGLVSSTGKTYTQHRVGAAEYDTGTVFLCLPRVIFEDFCNKIVSFAGPDVFLKTDDEGFWYITAKRRKNFPTLTFSVGDPRHPVIIRIPPERYAIRCNSKWCRLALLFWDGSQVILGRPFFTSYFSSYDLKSRTISIAEYHG
ncbi:hypothetical protein FOL47_009973 [Perkinsus chesapeaki]|uniref:Peptidase A1 domain-containing protein n=1 Tax=Perkinsus chesapeaki TaxID=330153 RepID=A0A7J6L5J4_PERCH|nr:hypothetical protein FOL47_009973 [Perkinsus chesapeaki]